MRIVLAYSGGLDTSVAIPWLREAHNAEVIAVTLDLGQGRELNHVRERALASGALRCHVLDVREEFARDYILPALQAGALYQERYPLATALGQALVAKKLIEIAHMENADAIAHGTGKDDGQVRLDQSVRAIDPSLRVMTPARVWGMTRADEVEYARSHSVTVPAVSSTPYTIDQNLWGRSVGCVVLEDPWNEPTEDIYSLTKSPTEAPTVPAYVEIDWAKGTPTRVNGVEMPLVELIGSLETIAGVHGVGRIDKLENRPAGFKLRELFEAPAAMVLHTAHRELEGMVITRDLQRLKKFIAHQYADAVHDGLWFTPTREAIDAFVQNIQPRVTGTVRLKLYKGDCRVVGRKSPFEICDRGPATHDSSDEVDGAGSDAFVKAWNRSVEMTVRTPDCGADHAVAPRAK